MITELCPGVTFFRSDVQHWRTPWQEPTWKSGYYPARRACCSTLLSQKFPPAAHLNHLVSDSAVVWCYRRLDEDLTFGDFVSVCGCAVGVPLSNGGSALPPFLSKRVLRSVNSSVVSRRNCSCCD